MPFNGAIIEPQNAPRGPGASFNGNTNELIMDGNDLMTAEREASERKPLSMPGTGHELVPPGGRSHFPR